MVGLQILDLPIGVRVPASQPYPRVFTLEPNKSQLNLSQRSS